MENTFAAAPPTPCTEYFFLLLFPPAIFDFTDVKNMMEGREGEGGEGGKETRLGFLCGFQSLLAKCALLYLYNITAEADGLLVLESGGPMFFFLDQELFGQFGSRF